MANKNDVFTLFMRKLIMDMIGWLIDLILIIFCLVMCFVCMRYLKYTVDYLGLLWIFKTTLARILCNLSCLILLLHWTGAFKKIFGYFKVNWAISKRTLEDIEEKEEESNGT